MFTVTCAPGLERSLCEELEELGLTSIVERHRAVEVSDDRPDSIYRALYGSRLASRILVPLLDFRCRGRDDLYRGVGKLSWSDYLTPDQTLAIDVHGRHKEFRNSLFAAQVVKDAICDQFRDRVGVRPSVQRYNPDLQLHLYLEERRAFLSLDLSGGPLHKRGYREQSVEAPLQENLAAAIVRMSGYKGEALFLDPCCGSGTLLIEAAMVATRTPAGFYRKQWGVGHWPQHDEELWASVRAELDGDREPLESGRIVGLEVDSHAARACRANLHAAGFAEEVRLIRTAFQQYEGEAPSLVITNPPFGHRLNGGDELRTLYDDLGHFLRSRVARPGRAFVLCTDKGLAKAMRLPPKQRTPLEAGGLKATLLEIELPEKN